MQTLQSLSCVILVAQRSASPRPCVLGRIAMRVMELATTVKVVSQPAANVKLTSHSARGECRSQVKALAGQKVQGDGCRGGDLVKCVERTGRDLLMDEDARLTQTSSIIQALLVEQVQSSDPDPGRREPG